MYGNALIEKVDVKRETNNFVILKEYDSNGKETTRREAKQSAYFNTWDEAHSILIKRAEERLKLAKREVDKARSALDNVKRMVSREG